MQAVSDPARFLAVHFPHLGTDAARRRRRIPPRTPLATLSQDVVASACARAARLGVRAGDGVLRARGSCRDIRFVPADSAAEARLLAAIARLARRRGLDARPAGGNAVVARLPEGAGGELRGLVASMRACTEIGLAARPGLADDADAAILLARHARPRGSGDGAPWIARQGRTAIALAELPLDALDLAPSVLDAARRAGLARVADLAALGPVRIAGRYGLDVARRVADLTSEGGTAAHPGPPAPIVRLSDRRTSRTRAAVVPPAGGVLGGGAIATTFARAAARPAPGSAAALAAAGLILRGPLVLPPLLAGLDDLHLLLPESRRSADLFEGRDLRRLLGIEGASEGGPRTRLRLLTPDAARWLREDAPARWRDPAWTCGAAPWHDLGGAAVRLGRRTSGAAI